MLDHGGSWHYGCLDPWWQSPTTVGEHGELPKWVLWHLTFENANNKANSVGKFVSQIGRRLRINDTEFLTQIILQIFPRIYNLTKKTSNLYFAPQVFPYGEPVTWKMVSFSSLFTSSPTFELPPLQWRHNGRDGVSNHQLHDCLLNRLFRRRSKKTPKLRARPMNSLHKGRQ